jgi:hypothetical protein
MPIYPVTMFEVRCDVPDCLTSLENDDEATVVYVDELAATLDAREEGWQVTTAGTFCPDHASDVVPLDQPGPTLFDAVTP